MKPDLVFRETDFDGWAVVTYTPLADRQNGKRIPRQARLLTVTNVTPQIVGPFAGWFHWKTRGTHPSGNRNHYASTLAEAQTRILAWAARRYRVVEE